VRQRKRYRDGGANSFLPEAKKFVTLFTEEEYYHLFSTIFSVNGAIAANTVHSLINNNKKQ
jgi:hypothetical protein